MGMKILIEIYLLSLKKDRRTRGHEVTLMNGQHRLYIRKYSFSQRTIREWNKLSTYCVNASSVNMLKKKIDKYIRKVGYAQMNETVSDSQQAIGVLVHLQSGCLLWMTSLLNQSY